jgi:polar amino acid transport system substrate-binding protein
LYVSSFYFYKKLVFLFINMYNNSYNNIEVILMNFKKFSLLVMLFSILAIFGSCAGTQPSTSGSSTTVSDSASTTSDNSTSGNSLSRIISSGKLIVGTSADYPPFEFHIQQNGQDEIVGFDMSLGQEIAKDLGVTLEIKDMDFDGLLAALTTDNVDIIIAGMNATDERKQSVDFSEIYYQAQQEILVREADYDKYKTVDDLKNARIGVQTSTIQEGIAQDQLPDATLTSLAKVTDLVLGLTVNNVDAVILDSTVADQYAKNTPGIKVGQVTFQTPDNTGTAVAIKKGNSDLVDKINATIERLKSDGSLDKFMLDNTNLADSNNGD